MHDLLEEETTASLTKELGDASSGAALSLNVAATGAEAMGMLDVVDAVDAEDAVDIVDMVEAVEPEAATKVSAPIAKLTAMLQTVHAGSGNAPRREETTEEMTSAFVSSAGSQATSKSIASPTKV